MIQSLGGYEILTELKSGGMGEVFLARKRGAGGFERLVALKTIRRDLREAGPVRTMFLDEARLLARLSHPAIAQVYDFGEDGDALFLAMEYVAGVRFRHLALLRPPPEVCARAIAEACRGLHAAHELTDVDGTLLQVVHRDVSPENLMLTFEGRVKVLDFGIALMRGRQAPVTEFGTIKGKPPYLSPEQVRNESIDRRSDVFSAGAVLYELLTGAPLFSGDSVYAVAHAIEHQEIPPPSRRAGALPDDLDWAVLRALERDRTRRWDTALAFAEALDRIAAASGGVSLETFARSHLIEERRAHQEWLRGVLASTRPAAPTRAGRPSGTLTVRDEAPAAVLAEDSPPATPAPPRRPRARVLVPIALALLGIATGYVLIGPGRRAAPGPAARPEGDSASPLPEAVPAASASSAPDPAALDAGPTAMSRPISAGPDAAARPPDVPRTSSSSPSPIQLGMRTRPHRRTASIDPATGPSPPTPSDVSRPEPAGTGFLTIAAEPFALIRVDGADLGTTPVFGVALPAGTHEVVLLWPDTGTIRLKKTLHLPAGKHEPIILK